MGITYAGESAEYREARDRLVEREIELRRLTETAAQERRALPPGPVIVEDYVFQAAGADGEPTDMRLSELFEHGKDSLVIYNYMFPRHPQDDRPGHRDSDAIRLTWGSELLHAPSDPSQDPRAVGGLEPLWNLLDLVPEGRGDWDEQLHYDCCVTRDRPAPAPAG